MIFLKTLEEIELMDQSNKIVHAILDHTGAHIKPGISTDELNTIAEKKLAEFDGATPAFLNYGGFPKVLCVSVNEEVVHGIPGDRIIQDGDVVSLDFGVYYKGYAGDSAKTFIVGQVSQEIQELVQHTKDALYVGIDHMRIGNRLHDIGRAINNLAKKHNYGNVLNFCGHGIGTKMHENPHVFNWVCPTEPNVRLQEGMVFAIEPMFLLGKNDVEILDDGWTVVTKDRKMSVHCELSAAITQSGPRILGVSNVNA